MTLTKLCCKGMEEEACQQAGAKSCVSLICNHLFTYRVGLHDATK